MLLIDAVYGYVTMKNIEQAFCYYRCTRWRQTLNTLSMACYSLESHATIGQGPSCSSFPETIYYSSWATKLGQLMVLLMQCNLLCIKLNPWILSTIFHSPFVGISDQHCRYQIYQANSSVEGYIVRTNKNSSILSEIKQAKWQITLEKFTASMHLP